jgi:hypothetical protein
MKTAHILGMSFPNQIPRTSQGSDVLLDGLDGQWLR